MKPSKIVQERRDYEKVLNEVAEKIDILVENETQAHLVIAEMSNFIMEDRTTTAIEILKAVKEMLGEDEKLFVGTQAMKEVNWKRKGINAEKSRLNSLIDTEIANIIKLQ